MAFVPLIELVRCREGGGTFITREGRELAVFRLSDPERVVVIDNSCPHAGGNLSGGEQAGAKVSCPWHHWEFDLDSGVCLASPAVKVKVYPSEVREGMVWADLENSSSCSQFKTLT